MIKPTTAKDPEEYISKLDEPRKSQIIELDKFIRKTIPQFERYLQSGMLGYGKYHYKYASGREGDWCLIGLASQKNYISIYICASENNEYIAEKYKSELPKASIGKSCIRFKKIEDLDLAALKRMLIKASKSKALGV